MNNANNVPITEDLENFEVSALKFRPREFSEVIGQEAITEGLENAINTGQIPKAMLFCGPRGVGKTTCARILARKINENELEEGVEHDFAFNIFELDAASNNTVDDIRNLIDQVRIPPQVGPYKVYIIDEVHMLSSSAFNAFLKTLEEPPRHAVFILATTEKHKIIPTILSRCQIFDFKKIRVSDTVAHLKKIANQRGVTAEEEALYLIARKADGAMRDALSIFDRVASYAQQEITLQKAGEVLQVLDQETFMEFTQLIAQGDIPGLLARYHEICMQGFDGQHFIIGLGNHFRDLLIAGSPKTIDLLDASDSLKDQLASHSGLLGRDLLVKAIDLATVCDYRYKESSNQQLLVEITLMKLASLRTNASDPEHTGEKKKNSPILPARLFRNRESSSNETAHTAEVTSEGKTPGDTVLAGRNAKVPDKGPIEKDVKPREAAPTDSMGMHDHENPSRKEVRDGKGPTAPAETREQTPDPRGEEGPRETQPPSPGPADGRISALSLSSIQKRRQGSTTGTEKKAHTRAPKRERPFELERAHSYWMEYARIQEKEGRKLVASSLEMAPPEVLDGSVLRVSLPNETMKKELEAAAGPLLAFMRDKLENDLVQLEVRIDEQQERRYIYTPEEKYQRLKEQNPTIEILRRELDLDI